MTLDYKKIMDECCGFLTTDQIKTIAETDRLKKLLVRCGCGRFIAPAQDVMHFIEIIQREGSEHVRDVSLLAHE